MSKDFATMVYQAGTSASTEGISYDFCIAESQEELEALLSDGWFLTIYETVSKKDGKDEISIKEEKSNEEKQEEVLETIEPLESEEELRARLIKRLTDDGQTVHPATKTAKLQAKVNELDKKQLLNAAFTEIGLMNYVYDMEPEDIQSAIVSMDAWIAELGVALPYAMTENPDNANEDQDSGLPIWANAGVYKNVAIQLCPRYGKTPSMELKVGAKKGLNTILARTSVMTPKQYDKSLPLGQGNKSFNGLGGNFVIPENVTVDENGGQSL